MSIGVVLGPALIVAATALAPASGQVGATVPAGGAAELSIGQLPGPGGTWGFGVIASGLLPLAGDDVVGTVSFGI
ncbi:MAG TPA: hypothetical protein VN886_17505 [Acidimicrobiales bacterium]|nr:hypothetical protein [Acidimicrobiales bacterium]